MLPPSLELACLQNNYEQVQFLLGDFHYDPVILEGVVQLCCEKDLKDLVLLALSVAPDREKILSSTDLDKNTPIHTACRCGSVSALKVLLEFSKDDPNRLTLDEFGCPVSGITPLHAACVGGHLDVVNLLLDSTDVNINCTAQDGTTALHLACVANSAEVVRALHRNEPSLATTETNEGHSPLQVCALFRSGKAMHALLEILPKPKPAEMTALFQVTITSSPGPITPEERDEQTRETLAAIFKHLDSVESERLLRDRFTYELPGKKKMIESALHVAARIGLPETVKLLLDQGGDLNSINSEKLKPMDLCVSEAGALHMDTFRIMAERWKTMRLTAQQKMEELLLAEEKEQAAQMKSNKAKSNKKKRGKKNKIKEQLPKSSKPEELVKAKQTSSNKPLSKDRMTPNNQDTREEKTPESSTSAWSSTSPATLRSSSPTTLQTQTSSTILRTSSTNTEAPIMTSVSTAAPSPSKDVEISKIPPEVTVNGQLNSQDSEVKKVNNKGISTDNKVDTPALNVLHDNVKAPTASDLVFDEHFDRVHPQATLLGLNVGHLLGVDMEELSVAQLEALREIHESQTKLIVARQCELARAFGLQQGKAEAEQILRLFTAERSID